MPSGTKYGRGMVKTRAVRMFAAGLSRAVVVGLCLQMVLTLSMTSMSYGLKLSWRNPRRALSKTRQRYHLEMRKESRGGIPVKVEVNKVQKRTWSCVVPGGDCERWTGREPLVVLVSPFPTLPTQDSQGKPRPQESEQGQSRRRLIESGQPSRSRPQPEHWVTGEKHLDMTMVALASEPWPRRIGLSLQLAPLELSRMKTHLRLQFQQ